MKRVVIVRKQMLAELVIDGPDDLMEFYELVTHLADDGGLGDLANAAGWTTFEHEWDVAD